MTNHNKIGILEQVMEKIEQNGTIVERYIDGRGCMCAVGYIMSECGVDMDFLQEDAELNGEFPSRLMCHRDIFEPLDEFGFEGSELDDLQQCNDDYQDDDEERAAEVIGYIRQMIKDIKKSA